eukprot:6205226-Pleurochrysis_carterae.AAC.1
MFIALSACGHAGGTRYKGAEQLRGRAKDDGFMAPRLQHQALHQPLHIGMEPGQPSHHHARFHRSGPACKCRTATLSTAVLVAYKGRQGNLKDILHTQAQTAHHPLVFEDKLHPAVRRQHAMEFDDETVAAADKEARMQEFIEACNEDAFSILMINIADTALKHRLRRDYDHNAHGARTNIEYLHEVKDNNTRITKASGERKALVEEGMASSTEAAARTMVEKLLELNSKLEGSAHHWSDSSLSTSLLVRTSWPLNSLT